MDVEPRFTGQLWLGHKPFTFISPQPSQFVSSLIYLALSWDCMSWDFYLVYWNKQGRLPDRLNLCVCT